MSETTVVTTPSTTTTVTPDANHTVSGSQGFHGKTHYYLDGVKYTELELITCKTEIEEDPKSEKYGRLIEICLVAERNEADHYTKMTIIWVFVGLALFIIIGVALFFYCKRNQHPNRTQAPERSQEVVYEEPPGGYGYYEGPPPLGEYPGMPPPQPQPRYSQYESPAMMPPPEKHPPQGGMARGRDARTKAEAGEPDSNPRMPWWKDGRGGVEGGPTTKR